MHRMLQVPRGKAWHGQSTYLGVRRPRPSSESALLWMSVSPSTEEGFGSDDLYGQHGVWGLGPGLEWK